MTGRAAKIAVAAFLLVVTGGCLTTGHRDRAYTEIEDSAVSAAVRRSFADDPAAGLGGVKVDTRNGTVYLSGVVDFWGQRVRAEQLAWKVPEVKSVINQLEVWGR